MVALLSSISNISFKRFFLFTSFFVIFQNTYSQEDSLFSKEEINYKLLLSSYYGITDSILYWLNLGADVNALSDEGISSLNYAIQSKNLNAVKALVFNGADVNYYSYNTIPAIFLAVALNQQSIVEFLLSKNAKTNITIKKKVSVLHYATKFADTNVIKLLIKYDSKLLQLKDEDGNTPLMTAVYFNRADVVTLLCRYYDNVSVPDKFGISPFLLSIMKSDTVIAEKLLSCGANCNEVSHNEYGVLEYSLISKNKNVLNWTFKRCVNYKPKSSVIKLAYLIGDRKLARELKKTGKTHFWGLVFQNINVGFSNIFTSNDFMFGLKSQIIESHLGFHASISYHTRLWSNRIIIPTQENNVLLQVWEQRHLLGTHFYKHLRLYNINDFFIYGLIGASYYYTNGRYRGFEYKPEAYNITTPSLGIFLKKNKFAFALSAEYFKFKDINAKSFHFNFSQFYSIPLNRVYIPKKEIVW